MQKACKYPHALIQFLLLLSFVHSGASQQTQGTGSGAGGKQQTADSLHLTRVTEMAGGPSCWAHWHPISPTHLWSCLLSLLCTMDTVLTAQTCVLTPASIRSSVWYLCARTSQRSETSASSQETCRDRGATCRVISPCLSSY